jgi:hypothetical protein
VNWALKTASSDAGSMIAISEMRKYKRKVSTVYNKFYCLAIDGALSSTRSSNVESFPFLLTVPPVLAM